MKKLKEDGGGIIDSCEISTCDGQIKPSTVSIEDEIVMEDDDDLNDIDSDDPYLAMTEGNKGSGLDTTETNNDPGVLNAFELDIYKSGRELVKNLRQKGWVNSDSKVDDLDKEKETELKNLLKNRICVCRVFLPKFETKLKIGKQVQLQVSDECMRINFPTQYDGYGGKYSLSPYLGLQLWFPREFASANTVSYWDATQKVLEIALPTDCADTEFEGEQLDEELLNEIF